MKRCRMFGALIEFDADGQWHPVAATTWGAALIQAYLDCCLHLAILVGGPDVEIRILEEKE